MLHLRLCHAFICLLALAAMATLWMWPGASIPLAGLGAIAVTGAFLAMGAASLLARAVRRRAHWHDPDTGLYGLLALAALDEPLRRQTRRRGQALTLLAFEVLPVLEYRLRSDHAAADALAHATARQLRRIAGPDGFAFRVSGAQFLCVLPARLREPTLRALRETMGYPCRIGFEAGGAPLTAWPRYRVATLHAGEDIREACRRAFRELGGRPVAAEGWDRQGDAEVVTVPMPLQASAASPARAVAARFPGTGRR